MGMARSWRLPPWFLSLANWNEPCRPALCVTQSVNPMTAQPFHLWKRVIARSFKMRSANQTNRAQASLLCVFGR